MKSKYFSYMVAICLVICVICLSVLIVMNAKMFYRWDMLRLDIPLITGKPIETIVYYHSAVVDYLQPWGAHNLVVEGINFSKEEIIHFEDVKQLFLYVYLGCGIGLIGSIAGIYYLVKFKVYTMFKQALYILLVLPTTIGVMALIDFNRLFNAFHELMFRNDYWVFQSGKDAIIQYLPEAYFMDSLIFILVLIIIFGTILYYFYHLFLLKGEYDET